MRVLLFFYFLTFCNTGYACQYVYPIITFANGMMGVMRQKDCNILQFFFFDPIAYHEQIALWSAYSPAAIDVSPDQQQISFLDNGRMRIYDFNKRSAQALSLSEPLYDYRFIRWLDNDHCYFLAKTGKRYGLYTTDLSGTVSCLFASSDADFLDAHAIDGHIFAIRRSSEGSELVTLDKNQKVTEPEIVYQSKIPLFFVRAESTQAVLVICGSETINFNDSLITFNCLRISKNSENWTANNVFSFTIPSVLIRGAEPGRLYESIFPLLPRFFDGHYYYASCTESNPWLNVFCYSLSDATIKKLTEQNTHHCFAPIVIGNQVWYGISGETDKIIYVDNLFV